MVHTCANNSWMNCHVVRRDDATNCSREEVDLWSWSAERGGLEMVVVDSVEFAPCLYAL